MPLHFLNFEFVRFDTFLAHLSNSDNRNKFCVAVALWKAQEAEAHVSLLLAGMFNHGFGPTVRWRMYDPNFPFDNICHDATYTQAYAALLQKVQHRLQQAAAALPYEALNGHVIQIACNSRGAGPNATQGDLQRSGFRMSHTHFLSVYFFSIDPQKFIDGSTSSPGCSVIYENPGLFKFWADPVKPWITNKGPKAAIWGRGKRNNLAVNFFA